MSSIVPPPQPPPPPPLGLVVSDPVLAAAAPAPASSSRGFSATVGEDEGVVYVSLVPGTEPFGVTATVRALTADPTRTTAVLDGGFDPVPVAADVGDTIEVIVRDASGAVVLPARIAVARVRRPVVVRTDPPPKKRDVPLNSVMIVVFSEPIDPATLTDASVQLLQGVTPVAGRLEFRDPANLTAAFVPAAPLAASTDYRLEITQGIRDLDGEPLEAPVTVELTTESEPAVMSQIAFVSFDSVYRYSLWVVNADGSGARELSNPPMSGHVHDPAWSPDGRRIAFARYEPAANQDDTYPYPIKYVYVMNADGSGVVRLTTGRDAHGPAWSPDGTKIAYSDWDFRPDSSGLGGGGIRVMNADGTGSTLLIRAGYQGVSYLDRPAWSPDGRRIAFSSAYDIFVADADGTGVTQLTSAPEAEHCPAWSPDGTRIAYRSTNDLASGEWDASIYVMNADGSGVSRLTDPGFADCPSWSPDGTMIAFPDLSGGPGVAVALSVMNADGSGITRLAGVPVPVGRNRVAWSPVGGMPTRARASPLHRPN